MSQETTASLLDRSLRFVSLRLSGLPGYLGVADAKIVVNDKPAEEGLFVDPTIRVLPPAWAQKFRKVEGKARKLIYQASPTFDEGDELPAVLDIRGINVVSASRIDEIRDEIRELIDVDFQDVKQSFLDVYDSEIVPKIREKVNDTAVWQKISKRIPSADLLKSRLKLQFEMIPITFLSEAIGGHLQGMAEQVANTIMGSVAAGLDKAASDVLRRLKDDRRNFRSNSLNELRKHVELIKDFGFLASGASAAKVQALESAIENLGKDAHEVFNQHGLVSSSVQSMVAAIGELTQAVNSDANASAHRRRKIVLEDAVA